VGLAQLAHQRGLVTLLLDKCCVTDAGTAHLAGKAISTSVFRRVKLVRSQFTLASACTWAF
jgi:hypothetical protein